MGNRAKLWAKYPTIQVNHIKPNLRKGTKHLLLSEPHTVVPANFDISIINQYESYITYNEKFCKVHRKQLKAKPFIMWGCFCGTTVGELDVANPKHYSHPAPGFTPYDEKIKGVCVIGKPGHRAREGNIYHLREEMAQELSKHHMIAHIYSSYPYGGPHYQGPAPGGPWCIVCAKKVSDYLFNFCPENTYHPMWSYGYLTEKLFRSFKAKTVAIYLGCYNIEKYVPKGLFIDLRDFLEKNKVQWDRLAEYLIKFPKEKYIEMTEKAHKWDRDRTNGKVKKFELLLKKVTLKDNL